MFKKKQICHFNIVTKNEDGSISIGNGSRIDQKGVGGKKRSPPPRYLSQEQIKPVSEFYPGRLFLELPIKTVSEANCSEHWTKKNKRHINQKEIITIFLKKHREKIKLPCHIKFTRLASRELDQDDNLPMAFKYINDYVCAIITGNYVAGRADGDKRISRSYAQEKSKAFGIRIEITFDPTNT